MKAPTELDASEIEAAKNTQSKKDNNKMHEAFKVTKTDSIQELVVAEFKLEAESPHGKKRKTEL